LLENLVPTKPSAPPLRIIVVCTANICRSPMATGLLKIRIAEDGLADRIEVISRGIHALEGYGAADYSALLMSRRGVDLGGHVAAQLTSEDVAQAALILVMEEAHRQMIQQQWDGSWGKVLLWREMAGQSEDVPDPYRYGLPEYEATLALMEQALDAGWLALRNRLGVPFTTSAEQRS